MPIDPEKLLALRFPDTEQSYTRKDVMLYALALGLGHDPMDSAALAFVYEENLKVLPTFPVVLGFEPFLLRDDDTGVDYARSVHGEEHLILHRLPAVSGAIIARHCICDVIDKGAGKGALLLLERTIADKGTGAPIATIRQTVFCRGAGGFGAVRPSPAPAPIPERAPDRTCDVPTRPDMALLYRLCADLNPLHADPQAAQAAGFPRPILHGLGTFGLAGLAILRSYCGFEPARLASMAARFTAPVFPGETIRIEMWRDADIVSFRARVLARDVVAIDNGRAELRG